MSLPGIAESVKPTIPDSLGLKYMYKGCPGSQQRVLKLGWQCVAAVHNHGLYMPQTHGNPVIASCQVSIIKVST